RGERARLEFLTIPRRFFCILTPETRRFLPRFRNLPEPDLSKRQLPTRAIASGEPTETKERGHMKRYFILPTMVLLLAVAGRSAQAIHDSAPDRRDMREIRSLARDLDERATALLREVERNRPSRELGHDRALELV